MSRDALLLFGIGVVWILVILWLNRDGGLG